MRQKIESHFGMILAIVAIIALMSRQLSDPKTEYTSILLEQAVAELEDGSTVRLKDITDFEWDVCYRFGADKTKEEVEEIIGFSSNSVKSPRSEDAMQLLFVKDGKVAANECTSPAKCGYEIDLSGRDRVTSEEDPSFKVTKKDTIVVLTLTEQD